MNVGLIFNRIKDSKLLKDTGTYTLFKIFDKLIPFFLLPIITRVLNPEEYGVFVLFQALAGVALPLMTLSIDSSILLNFFKVERAEFKNYFSSGFFLILISSIIFTFIILFVKDPLAILIDFPVEWIISIIILCFFQLHTNTALNLFQVKREPGKYGVFSIILTTLKNVLMLIFVMHFEMKWQGMILGYLVGYGLFFIVSIYLFLKDGLITKEIKKSFLIDNIKVGTPLSLHQIGSWFASSATRIIVSGLLGAAATGSFGIGATIGLVVLFVQDSFNKAFVPYLFEKLKNFNERVENQLIKLTYIYNSLLFVFSILIGLSGYLFLDVIFGEAYSQGKEVALLIPLAYAFDGMYKMHVNYIFYTKKTHFIFFITMTTGLLNIALSYLFIDMYGLIGGALSLSIINLLGYLLSWYVSNRVFPMKWFRFALR